MSFPRINAEKRTDVSFRNRTNPEHHRENTILEELPINMVDAFVTSDSLHLFQLGIMKKCILVWMGESENFEFKWSRNDIATVNKLLANCDSDLASDIHRSVRNLDCIKFWKGTEFRTFLLYLGVVVLKQSLREQEYNHFLKLFCAVILCSNDKYCKNLNIAKDLFDEYIEEYMELYGIDKITSNIHNLSHVVDDVRIYGNLSKIDSYVFENVLYGLKIRLRTCNRPLEQIARRIFELSLDYRDPVKLNEVGESMHIEPDLDNLIENGETVDLAYQKIWLGSESFLSSRKFGDKWFITKDDKIVEFNFASKLHGKYFLNGSRIKHQTNFFTHPFQSNKINIWQAKYETFPAHFYTLQDVKSKMICLHYKDDLVFMPLLHTL